MIGQLQEHTSDQRREPRLRQIMNGILCKWIRTDAGFRTEFMREQMRAKQLVNTLSGPMAAEEHPTGPPAVINCEAEGEGDPG